MFLLGDSVMLGSKAAAEKQFADWQLTFDAAVNRSTLAGAQIAAARRGEMRDFVVVQLGHNDGGSPSLYTQRVDAVMKALEGVPNVVWLTIHEVRSVLQDRQRHPPAGGGVGIPTCASPTGTPSPTRRRTAWRATAST